MMNAIAQESAAAVHPELVSALASYAHGIRLASVPAEVRKQAKLCILDTIGATVAGSRVDDWKPLMLAESADHAKPEATVIGAGKKLSTEAAARVNAYMGDIFELNDLIGGHGSIGNVCALIALAETLGSSGAELVESVIVGLEVTARVYFGYYPAMKPFTEVGMNPVTFPSSLGVAAGAARLLKLSQQQLAHAIGIGGTLAGWCPAEVVFGEGGTVKPMLFGACPATAGLAGAKYSKAGMQGPARLLEGPRGYFVTAARKMFPEAVLDRETWHVGAPRRKLHACCGYIHSPIDVVAAMRREGVRLDQADEIRIGVTTLTIPAVSKSGLPVSAADARFHLEYCVALAAAGEDVILPEHSIDFAAQMRRADVQALMKKIRVVDDAQQKHYHHCAVTLFKGDGEQIMRREGRAPKGSPQNPMSDADMYAKFSRLVEFKISRGSIDDYLARVNTLDEAREWDWLVRSFD
jgi:2-methylcitrate dehydratase PrpD